MAAPFREVYRNAMIYRAGAPLFAGAAWTLQSILAACVGFTLASTGVVLVVRAFGEDVWILFFGVVLVGLGAAGLYLPVELWRKAAAPVVMARRHRRRGGQLATIEGMASMSKDTLHVADRSFDLATTLMGPNRLEIEGAYVRVTYVPGSDVLAIVEVQG